MINLKNTILFSLLLFLCNNYTQIHTQSLFRKQEFLVSDELGFFTQNEKALLEQKLDDFSNKTSTQIAIRTIPSLKGYDIDDLSQRWLDSLGVGQEGKNNGVLILIKPKTTNEKGEVSISVGYGLEGVIPDAIAKRIIEAEILPNFRNGNYFTGIDAATNTLMALASQEFTAEEYIAKTKKGDGESIIGVIVFFIIVFVIFSGFFRKRRRYSSVGHALPFWMAMGMMGSSRSYGSGFGGFSSGSGGFGGFGGGLGGGGGASGSW